MTAQERIYEVARTERGVHETPGPQCTARIGEYLATVGLSPDDQTAWCSAFVNWCCQQVGVAGSGKPNARSWLTWGEHVDLDDAQPGDVCVLWRGERHGWQGHVGFYVSHGAGLVTLLGGNQHDRVCEASYDLARLLDIRRIPENG